MSFSDRSSRGVFFSIALLLVEGCGGPVGAEGPGSRPAVDGGLTKYVRR